MTPVGTSNELDVQNEWEENTHTHTHTIKKVSIRLSIYACHPFSRGQANFPIFSVSFQFLRMMTFVIPFTLAKHILINKSVILKVCLITSLTTLYYLLISRRRFYVLHTAVFVCVCVHINRSGLNQINPVMYVAANPVRGLLDRKRSEEHLQMLALTPYIGIVL